MAAPGTPPVDRDAEEPYIKVSTTVVHEPGLIRDKDRLRVAEEHKSEGNNHFRSGLWDEALAAYKTGLAQLPTRKGCTVDSENPTDDPLGSSADAKGKSKETSEESSTSPPTELDLACAKARSILYANIGACWVKLVGLYATMSILTWTILRMTTKMRLKHVRKVCSHGVPLQ
jgi:hypothetical protein